MIFDLCVFCVPDPHRVFVCVCVILILIIKIKISSSSRVTYSMKALSSEAVLLVQRGTGQIQRLQQLNLSSGGGSAG